MSSCIKGIGGEIDNRFFLNGMMVFLILFGVVLGVDEWDFNCICEWFLEVFMEYLNGLVDFDINFRIWGKLFGQVFGMFVEIVGVLVLCLVGDLNRVGVCKVESFLRIPSS